MPQHDLNTIIEKLKQLSDDIQDYVSYEVMLEDPLEGIIRDLRKKRHPIEYLAREVLDDDVLLNAFDNTCKTARDIVNLSKDKSFIQTIKSLMSNIKSFDKMKPGEATFYFTTLGPRGASSLSRWSNVLKTIIQDNHLGSAVLSSSARAWMASTPEERDTIVERMLAILPEWKQDQAYEQKKLKDQKPPEAPEGAIFDDYVFADHRDDVPHEEDNDEERMIYIAIKKHFSSNKLPLSKEAAEDIQLIIRNKWYPNTFHAPSKDTVYRGMTVPESWVRTALNLDDNDHLATAGEMSKPFTFTPLKNIYVTSWTLSDDVAHSFSQNLTYKRVYGVVLTASANTNSDKFLECVDGLYDIEGLDEYQYEEEVMGFGEIKVDHISWQLRKAANE